MSTNTMNNHIKKHHWFGLSAALWLALFAGAAGAQTGMIGGHIWTGATAPGGGPLYGANAPIYDAQVMIETADALGHVVAYADVRENRWEAEVPVGEYVVLFSAPGHDSTSRNVKARPGRYVTADAYLAPLPLPKANLLVYAFVDNKINGEDDMPVDWGLRGVTFHVVNERGLEVAVGVSGTEPENLPPLMGGDPNGLYYFIGLEPGVYSVWADSSTAPAHEGGTSDYYHTSTEEGTRTWETPLMPGDLGMEDGTFLLWFGFVPKVDQLPPAPGTGTITGILLDADGNDAEEPFPFEDYPLVSPNLRVPNGLVLLQSMDESLPVKVMATTEADPVTGEFSFQNVPPGDKYKIFCFDLNLKYVWKNLELSLAAGATTHVEPLVPRFFARVQGLVLDKTTMRPAGGAEVRLRLMDGRVWKKTTVDADGWYNFESVEEVEVIGFVDVKPPPVLRGARRQGDRQSKLGRVVQWYTFNYRADMDMVRIGPNEGDIGGFVFYDSLAGGTWTPNGVWDESTEATLQGATVKLYDGNNLIASTTTGIFDKTLLLSQGWMEPGTYPPDEIGNVFEGPILGRYEFTGLAPGWYRVKVVLPDGFLASPPGSDVDSVEVVGGLRTEFNRGVTTLVPRSGHIDGAVFDDVNTDTNPRSLLYMEKAAIPHAPVGIYDHLGYLLGVGHMGNPLCYEGSTACPPGEAPLQQPGLSRRVAPGVHQYLGNDPSQAGYDPKFFPMPLPYSMGQATFKYEADWSLVPIGGGGQPAKWLSRNYGKLNKLWVDLAAWQSKQVEAEAALITAQALPGSTKAEVRAGKKAVRKARRALKRASKKASQLTKKIARLERKIAKKLAR